MLGTTSACLQLDSQEHVLHFGVVLNDINVRHVHFLRQMMRTWVTRQLTSSCRVEDRKLIADAAEMFQKLTFVFKDCGGPAVFRYHVIGGATYCFLIQTIHSKLNNRNSTSLLCFKSQQFNQFGQGRQDANHWASMGPYAYWMLESICRLHRVKFSWRLTLRPPTCLAALTQLVRLGLCRVTSVVLFFLYYYWI